MFSGKIINIIFATSAYYHKEGWIIGYKNDMPWRGLVPSDMDRFKCLTKKQSLLIGYNTWESIPEKFRPFDKNLPISESRHMIILSKRHDLPILDPRVDIVRSFEEAVQISKSDTLWIGGGAPIFALALQYADFIHQTTIGVRVKGDTFFPGEILDKDWKKIHSEFFNPEESETPKDKVRSWYFVYKRKSSRKAA